MRQNTSGPGQPFLGVYNNAKLILKGGRKLDGLQLNVTKEKN